MFNDFHRWCLLFQTDSSDVSFMCNDNPYTHSRYLWVHSICLFTQVTIWWRYERNHLLKTNVCEVISLVSSSGLVLEVVLPWLVGFQKSNLKPFFQNVLKIELYSESFFGHGRFGWSKMFWHNWSWFMYVPLVDSFSAVTFCIFTPV